MSETSSLELIQQEIGKELAKKEVVSALLATTFKGLDQLNMQKAMFEGMSRGFTFKDFLQKNVYAIPYGSNYSLVSSIDYSRKIAMRSGLVGKSEPEYEFDENKKPISCKITVKRNASGVIGEYTAKVFFSEYTTGRNLWTTKPLTMLAKVAEMHALRSAFPEEMSQTYIEEEFEKETEILPSETKVGEYLKKLEAAPTLAELKKVFSAMPVKIKQELEEQKNILKSEFEQK